MDEKSFDFRISQPDCRSLVEAYKKMEEWIQSRKEDISGAASLTEGEGAASDVLWKVSGNFITDGELETLQKMRACLEESLPDINALLARCEGFIDQLESDTAVEPVRPEDGDNMERNGGILSLSYDYVEKITGTCDSILEQTRVLTEELTGVLDECGYLLEGTEEDRNSLTEAENRLNRIGNYKDSFYTYASGVQVLDLEMRLKLREIAGNEWKGTKLEVTAKEAALAAGEFRDYDNVVLLEGIAEQILSKDAGEWSQEEADFLARTWDNAIQNEKTGIIRLYTERLFAEDDTDRIQKLMECLEPGSQGGAYYTLNRIKYIQSEMCRDAGADYTCDVEVTKEDGPVRITMKLSWEGGILGGGYRETSLTVYDMKDVISVQEERHLEGKFGFTEEQIETMRCDAVTDADIEFLDHLTKGEYAQAFDVHPQGIGPRLPGCLAVYVLQIAEAELAKPQSTELNALINGVLMIDPHNNSMINDTSGQYIKMLQDFMLDGITDEVENISQVEAGSTDAAEREREMEREREIEKRAENYYKQYALWSVIKEIYYYLYDKDNQLELAHQCGVEGLLSAQINGLYAGEGDEAYYQFDFGLLINEPGTEGQGEFVSGLEFSVILSKLTGAELATAMMSEEIEKLKEERDNAARNTASGVVADIVNTKVTGIKIIYNLFRTVMREEDVNKIDSYGNELKEFPWQEDIENSAINKCLKVGSKIVSIIIPEITEWGDIGEEISEKKKKINTILFRQGIDIKVKYENEVIAEYLCGKDLLMPQVYANIRKLEEDGMIAFFEDMGYEEAAAKGYVDVLMDNLKQPNDTEKKIVKGGANLTDISADDLEGYISEIQSQLNQMEPVYDFGAWLRGEEQK